MASVQMGAKAYLCTPAEVRAEPPLRRHLQELTRLDYVLIDEDEEMWRVGDVLKAMDPGQSHLPAGPSPHLDASISAYCAGQRVGQDLRSDLFFPGSELYIGAFATQVHSVHGHVFFTVALAPEPGYIALETESEKFSNDLVHPQWMTLVQMLYDTWHPLYLFPVYFIGEGTNDREDVLSGSITYLHADYNYFGSDLAARLGRDRLLSAPGVRVAELSDGGVFIGQGSTDEAAAYLDSTKSPSF